MVVREDGSKWACQSCLKGHRVSGCNHTDRDLILVPKKGRPVTQCQHCRQERKKRSAHVSCDCAQPEKQHHSKEKCIHLREAEEKAKAVGQLHEDGTDMDSAYMARIAEEQGCCCGHGGKCSCALLMKQPEDDPCAPRGPAVKPKLEKATSEGAITQFKNGHHKPVHRKNHAAHECGMPYRIPMPRHQTDQPIANAARRSVDNLALDTSQVCHLSNFLSPTASNHAERRLSKSEQPSPTVPPMATSSRGSLQDPELVSIDFGLGQTDYSAHSAGSESFGCPSYSTMSGMREDPFEAFPSYAAASQTTLPNNNPFGVWPTPVDTTNMTQPALTAASSGTTSEIDEMHHIDDYMPSIQEDDMPFGYSNLAFNNSPELNRRSLPPGFFGNQDFAFTSMDNDWQNPGEPYVNTTSGGKAPAFTSRQTASLDQSWQLPNLGPSSSKPQRPFQYGLPITSRPQSRSLGPSNAPDDDVLRQLFPDIDENVNLFNGMSSNDLSSMDFGPMDESSTTFTSQPWADGSLSIQNDLTATTINRNEDISTQDFTSRWPQ